MCDILRFKFQLLYNMMKKNCECNKFTREKENRKER